MLPPLLEHYRLDKQQVLADAGIAPDMLARPDALLSMLDVMRLFMVVMQACRDPGLGFEVGRRVQARSYHVLGYAVLSSCTLGDAIDRLLRFEKLAGNLGSTEMRELDSRRLQLRWHCPIAGAPARFVTEAAITGWVTFARQLVAADQRPEAVYFRHSEVTDPGRYEAYFGCPVIFEAPFDGVELDRSLTDLPLASADPGLNQMMEKEAASLMADYDAGSNLLNAVRSQAYRLLADGEPSVEAVAERLGMAPRTLQSRLRRQHVSFQEVLDRLRQTLAELYLRDPRLSLTEIALLLGFSEQSSFTRAFRRWRDISPARFRQQLGD